MKNVAAFWLFSICQHIPGTTCGVVFETQSIADIKEPLAIWPEDLSDTNFALPTLNSVLSLNRQILAQQRVTEQDTGEPNSILAVPLNLYNERFGAAIILITGRAQAKQQEAMRQLQEAAAWFESLAKYHLATHNQQLITAVDLLAACIEHQSFNHAAAETVTTLAIRLKCDRISLGLVHNKLIKIEAISHSADFDRSSPLINSLQEAMTEAHDQDAIIHHPEQAGTFHVTRMHQALANDHACGNILTIPFENQGKLAGVLLFERPTDTPFDNTVTSQASQLAMLLGPVLAMKWQEDQPLRVALQKALNKITFSLTGTRYLNRKILAGATVAGFLLLSIIKADYRVTAEAQLEPELQRVVVAPQAGFIKDAMAKPGDVVQKDSIIGTLKDEDLQLERQKWSSQLNQMQREYRKALAQHDRSQVSIVRAKMEKADAQLQLINEQLARVKLTAPFDGRVVSGDLSQLIGAPVERGQILFTIAPLTGYRTILSIDERDIRQIQLQQQGELILAGITETPLSFTVTRITPVSVVKDGSNRFQVEAELDSKIDLLRPGMTGIAKINADKRSLLWIMTHKLIDRLRIFLWSWSL